MMKEIKEELLKEQIQQLLQQTSNLEQYLCYQDIQYFLSKSQPVIYCRRGLTETDVNVSIIEFGKILEFLKRNVACSDIFLRVEQSVTSEYHRQMKKQRLSHGSNDSEKVDESDDSEDDSSDSNFSRGFGAEKKKATVNNSLSPDTALNEDKLTGKKRKSDEELTKNHAESISSKPFYKKLLRKKYRQVIKVLRGYLVYLELITDIKFHAVSICLLSNYYLR